MADKETRLNKKKARLQEKMDDPKFDSEDLDNKKAQKLSKRAHKQGIAGRGNKYGRLWGRMKKVSKKLEKVSSKSKNNDPYAASGYSPVEEMGKSIKK
jgi:hypothetical protein